MQQAALFLTFQRTPSCLTQGHTPTCSHGRRLRPQLASHTNAFPPSPPPPSAMSECPSVLLEDCLEGRLGPSPCDTGCLPTYLPARPPPPPSPCLSFGKIAPLVGDERDPTRRTHHDHPRQPWATTYLWFHPPCPPRSFLSWRHRETRRCSRPSSVCWRTRSTPIFTIRP